jgi:hypothetical protein
MILKYTIYMLKKQPNSKILNQEENLSKYNKSLELKINLKLELSILL